MTERTEIQTSPTPLTTRDMPGSGTICHESGGSETRTHEFSPVPGYDLQEMIGRGGMGVVYRARDLAMSRDVAVKLLVEEIPAESSAAKRFLEEARITGQLQHPGIPAVYHIGFLPNSKPFLAMKLIKGRTLQLMLADQGLNVLAIFEAICQAVGYAHAHNVIHRDLKPTNIMVGAFGEVQVMDWGLAKVLTSEESASPSEIQVPQEIRSMREDTDVTQMGQTMGTPAYMPPEQARGQIDQVDQHSDVFSLGGILCAMLTGKPVYVAESGMQAAMMAGIADTRETLTRLEASNADPDLIALCKRCLSADKAGRPRDATDLARQVAMLRSAADERARRAEIERAESRVQSREAQKRRRQFNLAAISVAAVLLVGIAISTWQAVRATYAESEKAAELELRTEAESHARLEAEKARASEKRAEEQAASEKRAREEAVREKEKAIQQEKAARAASRFLESVLVQGSPEGQASRDRVANPNLSLFEALQYASENIGIAFREQPEIEAALRNSMGNAYHHLGKYDVAETHLKQALTLREKVLGKDHPDTLTSLNNLAALHYSRGDYERSQQLYLQALAGYERSTQQDLEGVFTCVNSLAAVYESRGDLVQAEKLYRQSLALREKYMGADHPKSLIVVNNLANLYIQKGEFEKAEPLMLRALAGHEKSLGEKHPSTLTSLNNLAAFYRARGDYARAQPLYERTLALREQILGAEHPDTLMSVNNLAALHYVRHDYVRAEPLFQRTLTGCEKALGIEHPYTLRAINNLALLYKTQEDYAKAEALFLRAWKACEKKLGPTHTDTLILANNLANLYYIKSEYDRAEPLFSQILKVREKSLGENHPDTLTSLNNLAELYSARNEWTRAEPLTIRAVNGGKKILGILHPTTQAYMQNLQNLYVQTGRREQATMLILETLDSQRKTQKTGSMEFGGSLAVAGSALLDLQQFSRAEPILRECLKLRESISPDTWTTFNTRSMLGESLLGQKKIAEAEPLLLTGFQGIAARVQQIPPPFRQARVFEAAQRVIKLYQASNQAEKAAMWRAQSPREPAPTPRSAGF